MLDRIKEVIDEVTVATVGSKDDLENFRLKYISRKGILNDLFEQFKIVANEQKRAVGQELNKLKTFTEQRFKDFSDILENASDDSAGSKLDLTLPVAPNFGGTIHPLTLTRQKVLEVFARMGFSHEDGPEVETDWYNFTALNFAENHPAREMQDTFFVEKKAAQKDDVLLRTHTSNVQVRLMEKKETANPLYYDRPCVP